jgi:hypothetical protein
MQVQVRPKDAKDAKENQCSCEPGCLFQSHLSLLVIGREEFIPHRYGYHYFAKQVTEQV